MFNFRSRTNLEPKASNWKLAWARWTACEGRKRVVTADDGDFGEYDRSYRSTEQKSSRVHQHHYLQHNGLRTDVADCGQMVMLLREMLFFSTVAPT